MFEKPIILHVPDGEVPLELIAAVPQDVRTEPYVIADPAMVLPTA